MVVVSYVYPNVSGITQRGGLLERWQLAQKLRCDYIEVPADFIKNKTEMERTGLNLGDFVTEEDVAILYKRDSDLPRELKYILHTEPSLIRRNGYGISHQAELKWYDKGWRASFVSMAISISEFFTIPPTVIEIHPGDRRNSFEDIVVSMGSLLDGYERAFGAKPLILLENRTGQFISSGNEIFSFWAHLSEKHSDLKSKAGIVLDVQQLYTVTKNKFLTELEKTPDEALKGFHIHTKHHVPSPSDAIPWRHVFDKIVKIRHDVVINPEIHLKKKVGDTIRFCEAMLHAGVTHT